MRKQLLIAVAFLALSLNSFTQINIDTYHTIINSSNAYVPSYIQVNLGDTILFATSTGHTTQQVSLATWNANDTTLLPGGLDGPPGGFTFVATTLGDIYYVCVEHVQEASQMKGMIKVSQLGIETNKSVTMQIMQSVSEQYIKLVVTGNATGKMHVEMLNLSGQLVKTVQIELSGDESSAIIQVGDMPKGVYMIRWSYGNVNKAKKIILQ